MLYAVQVQQTMHSGQRQEKSVPVLQTKEMFSSWDEEGRYLLMLFDYIHIMLLKKLKTEIKCSCPVWEVRG